MACRTMCGGAAVGLIVLSQYTGAAPELDDAIWVNPFDVDQLADAFCEAYPMPGEERRPRMARPLAKVENHHVFDWAAHIFEEASKCLKLENLPT